MPKRTPEGIMVGFLGTGTMEVNAATDLIEEFLNENLEGDESVRFIFPLTTNEFTDTMGSLVAMAKESEILYEVIRDSADKERRAFQEIAAGATKTYDVPDVFTQMENMLTEASRSILMVLWDSEREVELTESVTKFIDAEVDTRDLTDGLTQLGNEDDGVTATASEPEEVGEDEVPEGAEEETEGAFYDRAFLEKKGRDDIKAIAQSLGLPPRRSSAAMIDEILAAQGEPEVVVESPVQPEIVSVTVSTPAVAGDFAETVSAFLVGLDAWSERLGGRFDEFLNRLDKVEIQVATPPPPAVEPTPAPRRLSRG